MDPLSYQLPRREVYSPVPPEQTIRWATRTMPRSQVSRLMPTVLVVYELLVGAKAPVVGSGQETSR